LSLLAVVLRRERLAAVEQVQQLCVPLDDKGLIDRKSTTILSGGRGLEYAVVLGEGLDGQRIP